jgi:hypothetical protein
VDGAGTPVCKDDVGTPVPESMRTMRVEIVDAGGQTLGCLGL